MTTAQQEQLKSIMTLIQSSVPKSDLDAFISKLSEILLQHKQMTSEVISRLEQTYLQSLTALEGKHSQTLTELEKRVDALFVKDRVSKMQSEHSQRMSSIDAKLKSVDARMAQVKDGLPGPKGDKGERGFTGKTENLTDLYKRIDTLESELKKQKNRPTYITAGAGNMRGIVHAIDLSSSLNGVTKTFNIQAVWRIISVHLSSVPNILRETTDYTWTPTSITFTSEIDAASSLATGQTCILIVADA